MGIASLVCAPLVTATIAFVQCGSAQDEIARFGGAGAGMAKAGRVLGIVSLTATTVATTYLVVSILTWADFFEALYIGALLFLVFLMGALGLMSL
jgi:hypothetical protein